MRSRFDGTATRSDPRNPVPSLFARMIVNEHCPHCDESCLSHGRKLLLFPGTYAQCRSCGQLVSVPMFGWISVFPLFFAYMLLFQLPDGAMGMRVGISIGLAAMAAYYQVFLLPLVAR